MGPDNDRGQGLGMAQAAGPDVSPRRRTLGDRDDQDHQCRRGAGGRSAAADRGAGRSDAAGRRIARRRRPGSGAGRRNRRFRRRIRRATGGRSGGRRCRRDDRAAPPRRRRAAALLSRTRHRLGRTGAADPRLWRRPQRLDVYPAGARRRPARHRPGFAGAWRFGQGGRGRRCRNLDRFGRGGARSTRHRALSSRRAIRWAGRSRPSSRSADRSGRRAYR